MNSYKLIEGTTKRNYDFRDAESA